ncbi:MAG: beta strand repeat-containing protein [Planctomycetaceae bacterium]
MSGLRIDGNGGRGIVSRRPLTNFEITSNTIFNHTDAVVLNNVRGYGNFSDNIIDGEDEDGNPTADNGLILSVAAGERLDLLMENNEVRGHTGDGISLLARPGSRIQANDPNGELGQRTGILGNVANNNDRGIRMEARDGAVINASVEDNEFSENARDGFLALSDSGRVVLRSFARNTGLNNGGNGVFFHYRNGGEFFVISEDRNENGLLDLGEDVNGNGQFDLGFVQNTLSGNGETGLCIFGQGSGTGVFDIGGPDPILGNEFLGNADAGIAVDLTGTATAQVDAMFNTITAGAAAPASLTILLDFIDPAQGTFVDPLGRTMTPFDPTNFGFGAGSTDLIANSVLDLVRSHYLNIVTSDVDPRSPIPQGMQLDVDFLIGDFGTDPGTGNEYYAVLIGDSPDAPAGLAGQSYGIGQIRDANGAGPTPSAIFPGNLGDPGASVYADQIASFSPGLNPPDAFGAVPGASDPFPMSDRNAAASFDSTAFADGLTSGNLDFTTKALGLITSHELGHALSLRHVLLNGSSTPTGLSPIMATPALDGSIQVLVEDNEFAFSGTNPEDGVPFVQNSVQQLVNAIGLRRAGTGTGRQFDGMRVRASDDARLRPSRFLNNEITGQDNDGLSVTVANNAKAEGIDIQGNNISGNGGRGIHLEARGRNAMIFADQSIGGDGTNTLGGVSYSQTNSITSNRGDGIQVLAANGGMVNGNIIGNDISGNSGNGIALLIEKYGTLNFGDVSFGSNQVVRDNTIDGNGGFGILARSESVPGEVSTLNLITDGNTITNNSSGGLFAELVGSNNSPPAIPSPLINSTLDLVVRNQRFEANSNLGLGVNATGNTKANVLIDSNTITGTVGGDGVRLDRADSAHLAAVVENNVITDNEGDGIASIFSGNNRFDAKQPMSGMVNTIDWNNNVITGNTGNGASFLGRGDAQLVADGMNNLISNNSSNGILVDTREFSTFGDPSDIGFPPPGRRTVFKSNQILNNGEDGIRLTSIDESRQLIQVTSAASSAAGSPHAGGPTDGDTVISGNGSDGIHIDATDDSDIDLVVNSGEGQTIITQNGTNSGGGNGIRFDASGNTTSSLSVQETLIAGNFAGDSEDANNNGVLDFGEDANGNGFLDTEDADGNGTLDAGEDANGNGILDTEDANGNGVLDGSEDAVNDLTRGFFAGNLDIDVENGDGIQFNATDFTTASLQIGGAGDLGNKIQGNEDDGISVGVRGGLADTGSGATGIARPTINIVGNEVGGFDDGNPAGNGGDGLGFNVSGGAFAEAQFDGNVNGDNQPDITTQDYFRNEVGPIVTASIENNEFSQNGRRGANFRLTGASGQRERELLGGPDVGGTTLDLNTILFNNNLVRSNGEDGVIFQANARFLESREVFIRNNGAPGAGNLSPGLFSPLNPGLTGLNGGTLNGNAAYQADFLNLRTAQNSTFEALSNEIANNGTALIANQGTGMTIRVSPNAYLAADVQNTTFGGNLDADFFTESFNVGGTPRTSIDYINGDANVPLFLVPDVVFLDDTAQFDLRFENNTGNQIEVTSAGFVFDNIDQSKGTFTPALFPRTPSIFQVDNGPFLNNPNNVFSFQGSIQGIRGAFSTGGYNERAAADPLFPNIAFPPALP